MEILPHASIIYEDDFYVEDSKIPIAENGLEDWDCPGAFDLNALAKVIETTRKSGKVTEHHSKEHENKLGPKGVSEETIEQLKNNCCIKELDQYHIVLVDGIMLYHEDSPLLDLLDLKLFISAPYEALKERRESRAGYATIEGFWVDPPGYFDDMVWPGYVKTHGYLFENYDVNADLDEDAIKKTGLRIVGQRASVQSIENLLNWALQQIEQYVALQRR